MDEQEIREAAEFLRNKLLASMTYKATSKLQGKTLLVKAKVRFNDLAHDYGLSEVNTCTQIIP